MDFLQIILYLSSAAVKDSNQTRAAPEIEMQWKKYFCAVNRIYQYLCLHGLNQKYANNQIQTSNSSFFSLFRPSKILHIPIFYASSWQT